MRGPFPPQEKLGPAPDQPREAFPRRRRRRAGTPSGSPTGRASRPAAAAPLRLARSAASEADGARPPSAPAGRGGAAASPGGSWRLPRHREAPLRSGDGGRGALPAAAQRDGGGAVPRRRAGRRGEWGRGRAGGRPAAAGANAAAASRVSYLAGERPLHHQAGEHGLPRRAGADREVSPRLSLAPCSAPVPAPGVGRRRCSSGVFPCVCPASAHGPSFPACWGQERPLGRGEAARRSERIGDYAAGVFLLLGVLASSLLASRSCRGLCLNNTGQFWTMYLGKCFQSRKLSQRVWLLLIVIILFSWTFRRPAFPSFLLLVRFMIF